MTDGTTVAAPAAAGRSLLDRFLAVLPAAVIALVLLSVLLWEAATRVSPSVFTDELEWAQISRAIAVTGHAARRGQAVGFKSIYAYLIAPCWWLPTTTAAYTAIKYLNEVVMSLVAVPVYLLGRTLFGRVGAAVAAAATLCTSAFFYAPLLLPEVLAYPWFALTSWVAVRALAGAGRRWSIAAVVLSLVGVAVRGELAMGFVALLLAAAWTWVIGPTGRRLRASWTRSDHVGAAVLLIGAIVLLDHVLGAHSQQFGRVTQSYQNRMWTLGLEAGSALALGLGLLPMAAGLASLWLPDRRGDPRWRAFAIWLASCIFCFAAYTAIKAAYLSTTFATLVEERNLIYLEPLLLVGAVAFFASRRPSLPVTLATLAFTGFLVLYYGYQLNYPYGEAPGYGIAVMANRDFRWNQHDIRLALAGAMVVCAAVLLLRFRWRDGAAVRAVVAAGAVATGAWMLTGQITSARGSNASARALVAGLPSTPAGSPVNWLDLADHGHAVTYLGQKEPNTPLGIWLIEFWNKSLANVWTLDGSAPGPGPTTTPQLIKPDGTLSNDPTTDYVLEDNGVQLIGQTVKAFGNLRLIRLTSHPWRLKQAVYNVTNDGWITPPPNATTDTVATGSWASFVRGPGTVGVQISRAGFRGPGAPPAHVTVRIGPVALNRQGAPVVDHAIAVRRFVVQNGTERNLTFPHVTGPVAVQVRETPTFRPIDYGGTDPRPLGAAVGFSFTPTR